MKHGHYTENGNAEQGSLHRQYQTRRRECGKPLERLKKHDILFSRISDTRVCRASMLPGELCDKIVVEQQFYVGLKTETRPGKSNERIEPRSYHQRSLQSDKERYTRRS